MPKSIYEIARMRTAEREAEKFGIGAVFSPRKAKRPHTSPSDRREVRKVTNKNYYSKHHDTLLARANDYNREFKKKYGVYPSAWLYWKRKLDRHEISVSDLPDKYLRIYNDRLTKAKEGVGL